MSDSLTIKQPMDITVVNVHDPLELNYWSKEMNASKYQIMQAVNTVGTSANMVRQYIASEMK